MSTTMKTTTKTVEVEREAVWTQVRHGIWALPDTDDADAVWDEVRTRLDRCQTPEDVEGVRVWMRAMGW